jgi:rubrerythrin
VWGLVWGAAGWGAARAAWASRRRWMQRKGRCVVCGYDRKGLAARVECPECGAGT